jgi:hypothetical protein
MEESLEGGITETFAVLYQKLMHFLPNLLAALILFFIGIVLAKIVGFALLRLLKAINVDKFWDRAGIRDVLTRGGIKHPLSVELSRMAYWLIIIIFVVISLNALHIAAIETLLARFFLYLPNVFVALLILIVGYVLSNFVARAVLIALVNGGIRHAGLLARLVRFGVFIFAITMALDQLDIGRLSVLVAFGIMFGGVVLGFAIAFGLAAQHYIRDYLEKSMKKSEPEDDIDHV